MISIQNKIKEILEQIGKGEGSYNRDPIIHAKNCIDNMKELSQKGLAILQQQTELKCPLCDFRPRTYKNDDPETAKTRLHGHLFVKHSKGELIQAIFILAGWEE